MSPSEPTSPGVSSAPGPLAGVRVLELGGEQADYAGLLCAGLGASVVKIEPPEGSPGRRIGPFYAGVEGPERSLYFWGYNRGKRSLVLDLADPGGRQRLDYLLADADVLIDATPASELTGLGLDPAAHPELVHARLTPFGEDGPWAGFVTSDLVSLALGGVVMNCGYDPDPAGQYDLPPIAPQAWHSFHIAGEQLVIGIVSALLYRLRSGLGQKVSVAIHEAVAKNTEIDLMSWVMLRQPVYRQTCRHALATITNPSISYTKDGRWNLSMHVGSRDSRLLRPFMERYGLADGMPAEVTGEPAPGVRPVAGASSTATAGVEYVQRLSRRFTYEDLPWQEAQRAGLLWSPVRKPHENATDEHWLSRGTFADVPHPELDETFRYPVSKWISTRGSWRAGRRAPLLGEDDKLLRDGWLPSEDAESESFRTGSGSPRPRPASPSGVADLEDAGLAGVGLEEGLSALGKPFPLAGVRILDFSCTCSGSAAGSPTRTCPGRRRSSRGCCGPPSASRTRTRPTSTGCPVARSRTSRTQNSTRPSATRWVSGSQRAARGAPAAGRRCSARTTSCCGTAGSLPKKQNQRHPERVPGPPGQGRPVEPVDARRLAGQPPAAAVHGALRPG